MREHLYKKYSELPSSVHRYTDTAVRAGFKIVNSKIVADTNRKGDEWIARKKARFGLGR